MATEHITTDEDDARFDRALWLTLHMLARPVTITVVGAILLYLLL